MKEMGGVDESVECYHTGVTAYPDHLSVRPSPLVRMRGLLQADRLFAVALPEAERLAGLNRRFAGVLPAAVARACRVAAVRDETALVFCANGAAASRVRAQAKGLARALHEAEAPVLAVKVKVRADWSLPPPAAKHDLPAVALAAFRELDAQLPDGDLKAAVERLLVRRRGASS